MSEQDRWMAVANVARTHRFLRAGALVRVTNPNRGNAGDSVEVEGLSRSGRRVRTWLACSYLENFRVKFVPSGQEAWDAWTKEECRSWCSAMQQRSADKRVALGMRLLTIEELQNAGSLEAAAEARVREMRQESGSGRDSGRVSRSYGGKPVLLAPGPVGRVTDVRVNGEPAELFFPPGGVLSRRRDDGTWEELGRVACAHAASSVLLRGPGLRGWALFLGRMTLQPVREWRRRREVRKCPTCSPSSSASPRSS